MTTAIAERRQQGEIMESVLLGGDLSQLSSDERLQYYMRVCESAGLNPLTKPFDYLKLNGKLVLYAKKDATDQLRMIHKISVVDMTESEREGVFVVTAKVANAEGRTDIGKGAVNIANLKGDALANAIMKAETKAKRRATLSICGLGLLDETEIETIPAAAVERVINPETGRQVNPNSSAQLKKNGAWESYLDKLQHFRDARDLDGLKAWFASEDVQLKLAKWPESWRENANEEFDRVHDELEALNAGGA